MAGALLLLMALLTAKSLAPATLGVGGLPSVLEDALGSGVGKVLLADVAFAIFICCLAIHAASIRLAFSMARDRALPFGDHLSHVSEQRKSPALPAIVVGVVAFYPLYPLSIRALMALGLSDVASGLLISNAALFAAAVLASLLFTRQYGSESIGRTAALFLLVWPVSFGGLPCFSRVRPPAVSFTLTLALPAPLAWKVAEATSTGLGRWA